MTQVTVDRRSEQRFTVGDGSSSIMPFSFIELSISSSYKEVGLVRDISSSGLGFLTRKGLKEGTPLKVMLMVPKSDFDEYNSQEPLIIFGEVRWCKKNKDGRFSCGMKFDVQSKIEKSEQIQEIINYFC